MSSIYPTISHLILIYYCVELISPSVRFLLDTHVPTLTCNPKYRRLIESFFIIIGSHWTHRRPQGAAFPPAILYVSTIIYPILQCYPVLTHLRQGEGGKYYQETCQTHVQKSLLTGPMSLWRKQTKILSVPKYAVWYGISFICLPVFIAPSLTTFVRWL